MWKICGTICKLTFSLKPDCDLHPVSAPQRPPETEVSLLFKQRAQIKRNKPPWQATERPTIQTDPTDVERETIQTAPTDIERPTLQTQRERDQPYRCRD